ncbi:S-adenosyl-L-methionine-dependent methyltransferase [uncultured Caudovirales phage]|uniref:DNA (cytosine-5-)-methyltransferase n=1 Tax=uncultured Caudovirales phage TaxID=2100421 RepID=A0A6J5S8R0_9CAUD|nr:S-adenosyl-L-methionine-dependent methyltransferase [uncultured Caudovirales phage]CAB4205350.1 S-adenosyl-L-methionine-dependent methyltransferase [uncultured Caudovirales phage]
MPSPRPYDGIPTAEQEALQDPRVDPIGMGVAAMTGGLGAIPRAYAAAADGAAQYVMGSGLPYMAKLPLAMAVGHAIGKATPKEFSEAIPFGAAARPPLVPDESGLNVVGMFDGIGGLAEGLKQSNLPVRKYSAYEVDPKAARVASNNHPYIEHQGSIENFRPQDEPIDLLCGGFPCQDLSRGNPAGKGLEGDRSSLFWEMVRAIKEGNPRNWLVENVYPRGSANNDTVRRISDALETDPVAIDAKDLSAMARPRLFWSNMPIAGVAEPSPARFADALDPATDPKYWLSQRGIDYMNRPAGSSGMTHFQRHGMESTREKSLTIPRSASKGIPYNVVRLPDGSMRRLTPEEVEGLFGFPQGYTAGLPDSTRLGLLGNSFSVPVINHILKALGPKKP